MSTPYIIVRTTETETGTDIAAVYGPFDMQGMQAAWKGIRILHPESVLTARGLLPVDLRELAVAVGEKVMQETPS